METYHFKQVVKEDGSVLISGLPPRQEVDIFVVEPASWEERFTQWMDDVSATHPLAKMSKEEILGVLSKTREKVAKERHAS